MECGGAAMAFLLWDKKIKKFKFFKKSTCILEKDGVY